LFWFQIDMKKIITILTSLICFGALAQDVATVLSHQPRIVTVQQQQCGVQEVVRDNRGQDSTIGALAGAAIGSTVGGNNRDRLAGGVVGALIGGAIGNNVGQESSRVEQRQVCRFVPVQIQQGEWVTFTYQGRTFVQEFK
jgi:outer membrane lipoprotein SlyB